MIDLAELKGSANAIIASSFSGKVAADRLLATVSTSATAIASDAGLCQSRISRSSLLTNDSSSG